MHNGVKPILKEHSYIFKKHISLILGYNPQVSRENTGAEKYIWMFIQKDSQPSVCGMYAIAPHYRHHFHLLFWFFINMISVEEFLFLLYCL